MRTFFKKKKPQKTHEGLKGFFAVFTAFFIGFALCTVYVFLFEKADTLPHFFVSFQLSRSIQYFITFMPVFLLTALLIGYAAIFGKSGHNTVKRYSLPLLNYLKDVFVILLLCITAYFLLRETALPRAVNHQQKCIFQTQAYYDFLYIGKESLKKHEHNTAYRYAKYALLVWKDSTAAHKILDAAKIHRVDEAIETEHIHSIMQKNRPMPFSEHLTAQKALSKSKKSMQEKDFYTAHFYAVQCSKLAASGSKIKKEGEWLTDFTWKQIKNGFALLNAQFDIQLYNAKKEAYDLLKQQHYAQAYYRFLAIKKMIATHDPEKKDRDVERLFTIAQEKLLTKVFFNNETLLFPLFVFSENIAFTVTEKSKNLKTHIKIQKLAWIPQEKTYHLYGKNTEITHYAPDGTILSQYLIPFTKFVPSIDANGDLILNIQMNTLDTAPHKKVLRPLLMKGTLLHTEYEALELPMTMNDLNLIISASKGENLMTLTDLYQFRKKAAHFGFDQLLYTREIMFRITSLLVILIVSIYALTFGWRFRIPPHTPFRLRWIVTIPAFLYASGLIINMLLYASRLVIVLLTTYCGFYISTLMITLCYAALFAAVCFLFVAQRSDN